MTATARTGPQRVAIVGFVMSLVLLVVAAGFNLTSRSSYDDAQRQYSSVREMSDKVNAANVATKSKSDNAASAAKDRALRRSNAVSIAKVDSSTARTRIAAARKILEQGRSEATAFTALISQIGRAQSGQYNTSLAAYSAIYGPLRDYQSALTSLLREL